MIARQIVDLLLESEERVSAEALLEASVHLPHRGRKWVAVFSGPTPGKQTWRSTGLEDQRAALILAKEWEAAARREREAIGFRNSKPTIRVRHGSRGDTRCGLTQKEVAAILHISERAVREIERRAFEKLRRHPKLRAFWRELEGNGRAEMEESDSNRLTHAEVSALFALTRSPVEREVLSKLLRKIGSAPPTPRNSHTGDRSLM